MRALLAFACLSVTAVSVAISARNGGGADPPAVDIARVPNGGLQPQVFADASGHVHLLYLSGDPSHSDIYYVHSNYNGSFTQPMRVNSQPGSAMAVGNMRGPHVAVGRRGIVYVAWFGSDDARPRAPESTTPILYSRLLPGATTFEPQRNVVQYAIHLDGGAIAADADGHVYVAWHGLGPNATDESGARLWVTTSKDDGGTFDRERPASDAAVGACGCCGLAALADRNGSLDLLFRSATAVVHRDAFFATSRDYGQTYSSTKLQAWNIGACPMSTFSLASGAAGVVAAWETAGRVQFTTIDPRTNQPAAIVPAPAGSGSQKYPVVAIDGTGRILFAWAEGMAWQRGGDLVWQVYGPDGRPTAEHGRRKGVPAWSLVAAYAQPTGGFRILY